MKWKGQIMSSNGSLFHTDSSGDENPFRLHHFPHLPKQRKGTSGKEMAVGKSKWEGGEQSEFNSTNISWVPVLCQACSRNWRYIIPSFKHLTELGRIQAHDRQDGTGSGVGSRCLKGSGGTTSYPLGWLLSTTTQKKLELLGITSGNAKRCSHYGWPMVFGKLNIDLSHDPAFHFQNIEKPGFKHLDTHVHSSIIYNRQKIETTQVPINR